MDGFIPDPDNIQSFYFSVRLCCSEAQNPNLPLDWEINYLEDKYDSGRTRRTDYN